MLSRSTTPQAHLRRHVERWIQHALANAPRRAAATPRQIHQLRVALKHLRAMWRLLTPFANEARRRQQNAALRDAGRTLAQARDLFVARQTLRSLAGSDAQRAAALRQLAAALPVEPQRQQRVPPRVIQTVTQARAALLGAVAAVSQWDQVEQGLDRLQRRARRAREQADDDHRDDQAFHQWRMRCKDVYYAVDMLPPRLRKEHKKLRRVLRSVNALLGHDHDLVVLRDLLGDPGPLQPQDPQTVARALALIDKRTKRIRRQTLKLTRKI